MKPGDGQSISADELLACGLPAREVADWLKAAPESTTDYVPDCARYSAFWQASSRLIGTLPPRPQRSSGEQAAAQAIQERARAARTRFLERHADAVYDALTGGRTHFVRV